MDALTIPLTFSLSFLPRKNAICLVTPLASPKVEIITKMLIKTNASEKIPYSVWVVYLTMTTLLTKAKSRPMMVPVKMMPVPFAIFCRLWVTISDKGSLFIFMERVKGKWLRAKGFRACRNQF